MDIDGVEIKKKKMKITIVIERETPFWDDGCHVVNNIMQKLSDGGIPSCQVIQVKADDLGLVE